MTMTIIVPTRERADTLLYCLKTITSQNDARLLEIIVSDNCSSPATKKVVDSFNDSRIRYIRPGKRLGMSEHWEFALAHARGDWITIIGDDDGLLPNAVEKFFGIVDHVTCKAVSSLKCNYKWPSVVPGGYLVLRRGHGGEKRNARLWLGKTLKGKRSHKELPYLYTGGFVHKDIIKKITEKSGEFYKSITPDVYSSIAVASVLDEYFYTREPLAIVGTSAHSNGLSSMKNSTIQGPTRDFFLENNKTFLPHLGDGFVQSLPMIVYEAYLQSAHLRSWQIDTNISEQLSLTLMAAKKGKEREVEDYCKAVALKNNIDFDEIILSPGRTTLNKLSKRVKKYFDKKREGIKKIKVEKNGVQNIYDACIFAQKVLEK